MKKRKVLLILLVCVLALMPVLTCACNNADVPPTDDNDPPDNSQEEPTQLMVYFQVAGSEPQQMQAVQGETHTYTITITLKEGDVIAIYDSNAVLYKVYNVEFDGNVTVAGEYVFTLRIVDGNGIVYVDMPQADPNPNPDPDPDPDPEPTPKPKDTKVTVYYTNSEGWSNVYAYVWNYATNAVKVKWPGTKLATIGTSGFGEKQYSVEVDYAQYDRIIFNDGGNKQTKDLIVGNATSGYYGTDGIFTMNATSYGKVEYFTLKDTKNLSYIASNSKKISVYTPNGYTNSKKYGVLYMFDSQNLYAAADGAQPSRDSYGSWAVDVSVNNLVQRGEDGIIIVAIDNTDGHRDSELTMSQSFGKIDDKLAMGEKAFYNGKLDELGNFMKETLMPWVQAHYSVDTSRENTGIAGSSSGGLAAYYLGLRDNDLYGYVGAFSPANGLFVTSAWTNFYQNKDFSAGRPKIYVYCGQGDKDLEDMLLPATKEIIKLKSYGFAANSIIENYVKGGTHSESYWRIAFAEFLSKML